MNMKKQIEELKKYINNNENDKLLYYLRLNKFNLNKLQTDNFDSLIYCIENDFEIDFIKLLIKFYNNINYEIENEKNPLFLAIKEKKFIVANLILKNKGNINYVTRKGNNILFYLIERKKLDLANLNFILL
ncbi:hypothetical protein H8356DRAFT_1645651, partial [Neocallimastix lanati (nom. inval.)]